MPADIISSTDKLGEGLSAASAALLGASVPRRGGQGRTGRGRGSSVSFVLITWNLLLVQPQVFGAS